MIRLFYKYKASNKKYVARKRGQIKVTGWVLFIISYVIVGPLFSARMYSVSHLYAVKPLSKWMASLACHSMLCFILGGSFVSMPLPITCPEIQSFELFWHFQHRNLMAFCLQAYLKQECNKLSLLSGPLIVKEYIQKCHLNFNTESCVREQKLRTNFFS